MEVMLALDLADRMAGTAYLDDYIWPELSDSYSQIPVLNEKYPNITELMAVDPDFVYASYSSAFSEARLNYSSVLGIEEGECSLMVQRSNGENRTHCREELHDFGIQTYLSKPYCELTEHQPDETTLDVLYNEIYDVASIFGAFDNARVLVDSIQGHFDDALRVASTALMSGMDPIKVLWLDGWDDETPFVGACCGSVQVDATSISIARGRGVPLPLFPFRLSLIPPRQSSKDQGLKTFSRTKELRRRSRGILSLGILSRREIPTSSC